MPDAVPTPPVPPTPAAPTTPPAPPAPPQPPTPPEPPAITDPARIRALAHPLRLELLEILGELGEATATQCAERTGETVANCSFHLRTLARAGFIEPAPGRGREKPWRPVARSRRLDIDPDNPRSQPAMTELVGLMLTREVERFRDFVAAHDRLPEEWRDTVAVNTGSFWATADELRGLVETITHLLDPFTERQSDPSLRPPGARLARLFAAVNPDTLPDDGPEPAGEQSPEDPR